MHRIMVVDDEVMITDELEEMLGSNDIRWWARPGPESWRWTWRKNSIPTLC